MECIASSLICPASSYPVTKINSSIGSIFDYFVKELIASQIYELLLKWECFEFLNNLTLKSVRYLLANPFNQEPKPLLGIYQRLELNHIYILHKLVVTFLCL